MTNRPIILVVDDEVRSLQTLRRVLDEEFEVLTAASAVEAEAILAAEMPAAILCDQRMPQVSGIEFLREVRERWPEEVRIVLSGYTDLKSVTEAINEGSIYKFLTKPWDDKQIREHVQKAFQYHRTLQG